MGINICQHLVSLVIPYSDPRDIFFYPTLTLLIDSYNLHPYFVFTNREGSGKIGHMYKLV